MSLTATMAADAFTQARDAFPGSAVRASYVATDGTHEVTGLRGSQSLTATLSLRGLHRGYQGSIRFACADLGKTHPKIGDRMTLTEWGEAKEFTILDMRYDQPRATVRVDYGDKFA
jgi:hypothetical protein